MFEQTKRPAAFVIAFLAALMAFTCIFAQPVQACADEGSLAAGSSSQLSVQDNAQDGEQADTAIAPAVTYAPMYRAYNPYSGEHFYTASKSERNDLIKAGWHYEGPAWAAPSAGDEVYRLYNPIAGDHHYTLSKEERDSLVKLGWKYEGVGWRSCPTTDKERKPLYRQYNPNAQAGAHNFTLSKSENDSVVAAGWRAEGYGWYGHDVPRTSKTILSRGGRRSRVITG